MTNFVNGQPIIGKTENFDRPIRFMHWLVLYLFIMILIIYDFFLKKIIMAQVLLPTYYKQFDESKRGWGRNRQAQQINKTTISLT
jgi:hypothetical protein